MARDQVFFVGQKAIIEKDGEVLWLHDPVFGADLPGGKIQVGETDFIAALKREVFEETGLEIKVHEPFYLGYFEIPRNEAGKRKKVIGKKIFTVVYRATYLSGELILSDEHDSFKWVNGKNYKDLNEDMLGTTTKALAAYFKTK